MGSEKIGVNEAVKFPVYEHLGLGFIVTVMLANYMKTGTWYSFRSVDGIGVNNYVIKAARPVSLTVSGSCGSTD